MGCSKSQPEETPQKQGQSNAMNFEMMLSRRVKRNLFRAKPAPNGITEFYEIIRAIGSGTIGTLFYARHLETEEFRTLREINKLTLKDEGPALSQEVSILSELDHPNIRKVYECVETSKNVYISMEFIDGLPLNEKVKKTGCETYLFKVIFEVFGALEYIHSRGIAHCNLCPEYIIQIPAEGYDTRSKIIGFLAAQKLNDKQDIQYSNLKYQYCSPEFLRGEFDEKTDMWNCGIILYEMLVGRLPFPAKSKPGIIDCILHGDLDFSFSLFTALSNPMQGLIKSLLEMDPSKRMTTTIALHDPTYECCTGRIAVALDALSKLKYFQVNCPAARSILVLINKRLGKPDHELLAYFKELDENFDGKVSRDELVDAYERLGIDVEGEADAIISNLDLNGNGFIDYTELKVSLMNWSENLKEKFLKKVFLTDTGSASIDAMRLDLIDVKQKDWIKFLADCPNDGFYMNLAELKKYLKANIVQ